MVIEQEQRISQAAEIRYVASSNLLTGYGIVWDVWADLGGFRERIQKGATKKTIQESDIRFLINHDPSLLLGRLKAGTLRLEEDDHGLRYEVDLPDTSYANNLRASVKRGDISQSSFGFQTIKDRFSPDGKNRTLLEIKLFDVSIVTFPAYPQTSAGLRSGSNRANRQRILGMRAKVASLRIERLLKGL